MTTKKQAIVLIHGIGEQRPMGTATTFAETIAGDDRIYYKPSNYGLRGEINRISIQKNKNRPTTDIYEYYWAHEFRDNKLSTIHNWLFHLVVECARKLIGRATSSPGSSQEERLPVSKEGWVVFAGCAYGAALIVIAALAIFASQSLTSLVVAAIAGYAIYKLLLSNILLGYLADAAKYLSNHPDNISARERVRSGAIKLLRDLNESEDYDRVLVVGHSLGSVIGSDALTQYWHEVCDKTPHRPDGRVGLKEKCDAFILLTENPSQPNFISQFQMHQRLMREALVESGCPWKITDLVTIGSPLSFANFLLARNDHDFRLKTAKTQQLLLCPPPGRAKDHLYLGPPEGDPPRSSRYPAASTAFLYTRWTNLYGTKDLIGGRVAPLYGIGVLDVKVNSTGRFRAHTEYFSGRSEKISNQLRSALKLETGLHRD
ncbi:hypothetical protein WJ976_05210 [Achromobacter denitrificans]